MTTDANGEFVSKYACWNGEGVEKNQRKAKEWYRKSAEQSDANVQYELGNAHWYGKGVKKDQRMTMR